MLAAAEYQRATAGTHSKHDSWQCRTISRKTSLNSRWPRWTCVYSPTSGWGTLPLVAQQRACDWFTHSLYHDWWELPCQNLSLIPSASKVGCLAHFSSQLEDSLLGCPVLLQQEAHWKLFSRGLSLSSLELYQWKMAGLITQRRNVRIGSWVVHAARAPGEQRSGLERWLRSYQHLLKNHDDWSLGPSTQVTS